MDIARSSLGEGEIIYWDQQQPGTLDREESSGGARERNGSRRGSARISVSSGLRQSRNSEQERKAAGMASVGLRKDRPFDARNDEGCLGSFGYARLIRGIFLIIPPRRLAGRQIVLRRGPRLELPARSPDD